MDKEGRLYLEAANKGLKRWKERTELAEALADRRGDLLRAAYEFIDGITLQEAELRMAIEKELEQ